MAETAETYDDFTREPSKPHQCIRTNNETGERCRSFAMHNEYVCYQHRTKSIPPVIENDPFLIDRLDTLADVRQALLGVASRLAANRMDFKRAACLISTLQAAIRTLPPHPRPAAANSQPTSPECPPTTATTPAPAEPSADSDAQSAAATESPLAQPDRQPTQPANQQPVQQPALRDFTSAERTYLSVAGMTGRAPVAFTRPASLSDQDIASYLAHRRWSLQQEKASRRSAKSHNSNPDTQPATLPCVQAVAQPITSSSGCPIPSKARVPHSWRSLIAT